jgi:hypothetical protein
LEVVRAAWIATGYQEIEVASQTLYKLRDDYEISTRGPARYAFSSMNYAAILADGSLVFTSNLAAMSSVLETAAGQRPSLATRNDLNALLSHAAADFVAVVVSESKTFGEFVELGLVGLTAGGPASLPRDGQPWPRDAGQPISLARLVVQYKVPVDLEATAESVRQELTTGTSARWETPFATLFPVVTVSVVDDAPILIVDLSGPADQAPTIVLRMFGDDYAFLSP